MESLWLPSQPFIKHNFQTCDEWQTQSEKDLAIPRRLAHQDGSNDSSQPVFLKSGSLYYGLGPIQ